MADDSLQKLQAAGVQVGELSDGQKQALSTLSPDELDTMISIKKKLDSAGEVEGFLAKKDNNVGASFF
jgi:hypothetical protein